MSKRLAREIISDDEEVRHDAFDEALELDDDKSLPILRRGLKHWDRRLRNKCSRAIIEIQGVRATAQIFPLFAEGLLFKSSSLQLLLDLEDAFLIRYLKRKRRQEDEIGEAAAAAYQLTREYRSRLFKKEERSEQLQNVEVQNVYGTSPNIPFLEMLAEQKGEGFKDFLLYLWGTEGDFDTAYTLTKIPKKYGGERHIEAPHPVLKQAQRVLLRHLESKIRLNESCHGFRRQHSTYTNALPHVGKRLVINLDIKDFFPSVTINRIYGLLRSLGYEQEELRFLTQLVSYAGRLPQGAPTSPIIANAVCSRLDSRLNGLCEKTDATYTRYADDMTISGMNGLENYIALITKIVREEGFVISIPKLRILRHGSRQEVTGLTVNEKVSVPRALRKRLRACAHRASKGESLHWKGNPLSRDALRGYISYLSSIHPDEGKRMIDIIS